MPLNDHQLLILKDIGITITPDELSIFKSAIELDDLSELDVSLIAQFAYLTNALYRAGCPWVSDSFYDHRIISRLATLDPDNPFLHAVEPELVDMGGKVVILPQRMLSTEKAYSQNEINKWLDRLVKEGALINLSAHDIIIRLNPKLDGFACYDDGAKMYTRGDGYKGTDITRVIDRGIHVVNGLRGLGPGEIVVNKAYFDEHLSEEFDNSRNFQSSVIKEKELSALVQQAFADEAVVFYPFAALPCWIGSIDAFKADFEAIVTDIWNAVPFDVDGVVATAENEDLRQHMGATSHHHRWQIAFKKNDEEALVEILSVTPQTAKTGRITPVAELTPTRISNAMLTRATAHHYGRAVAWGLGKGAVAVVVRSGLVIPKIVRMESSVTAEVPTHCTSCGAPTEWQKDNLYCTNKINCPAQIEGNLEYFFKTLGNIDGFGSKTLEVIHQHGVNKVSEIYALSAEQFKAMGLGDKDSQNLVAAMIKSRKIAVEDWRFLAAFSIPGVGRGGCERLLKQYALTSVFDLTIEQVASIKDFAEKTATTLVNTLKVIKPEFDALYQLGFNLTITPLLSEMPVIETTISGKTIVFTGSMVSGKRDDMEAKAKTLGAKVGSSVSSKTDYLVIGEKVGANKIADAQRFNVVVVTESDYLKMIG